MERYEVLFSHAYSLVSCWHIKISFLKVLLTSIGGAVHNTNNPHYCNQNILTLSKQQYLNYIREVLIYTLSNYPMYEIYLYYPT